MKRLFSITILLILALAIMAPAQDGYQPRVITTTIASGASITNGLDLGSCTPIRMTVSTVASGWTAANITMQTSDDEGTTYSNYFDQYGTEITMVVTAAGTAIQLDPATFNNLRYVKFRSGTSSSAVNQAATRTLRIACKIF